MKQKIKAFYERYGKKGIAIYVTWLLVKWTLVYFFGSQVWDYFAN